MKITICSSGRFHVADLARELLAQGHDIQFHSYVPAHQLERHGIPRKNQYCHLSKVAPLVFAHRKLHLSRSLGSRVDNLLCKLLDNQFARIDKPSDVFIGMSGLCLKSLTAAKARGAHVVLERGSTHILEQQRILEAAASPSPRSQLVSTFILERELEGYQLADTISIPSLHVEQSFISQGIPSSKLFRNPYGVDLDLFSHHNRDSPAIGMNCDNNRAVDVINTGTWCLRKGSDVLAKVVLDELGLSLLHVGAVGDLPLPCHPRFHHHPPVPQSQLPNFYQQAHLFAMPSREDGFGMVFSQALACGLPIVGSTSSGVPDLTELLDLKPPIAQAVQPNSPSELARAVRLALDWARMTPPSHRVKPDFTPMTWGAYGMRYSRHLQKCLGRA